MSVARVVRAALVLVLDPATLSAHPANVASLGLFWLYQRVLG